MGSPGRLLTAIAYLKQFYPRQEVTPALLDGYVAELADLPIQHVEQAVRTIVRTSQWFPTVAELRAAAVQVALGLPSEDEALAEVERYVGAVRRRRVVPCGTCEGRGEVAPPDREPTAADTCPDCSGSGVGWDGELPVLHPAVREALDLVGGYRGYAEADEPSVARGQFLKLYRSSAARLTRGEQVGELPAGPLELPAAVRALMPPLKSV